MHTHMLPLTPACQTSTQHLLCLRNISSWTSVMIETDDPQQALRWNFARSLVAVLGVFQRWDN